MYTIEPEFICRVLQSKCKLSSVEIEKRRYKGRFILDHAEAILDTAKKVRLITWLIINKSKQWSRDFGTVSIDRRSANLVLRRLNSMTGKGVLQSITLEDKDILPVGAKRRLSSRASTSSSVDLEEALRDRDSRIEDLEETVARLRRQIQLDEEKQRSRNIFRVEYTSTRKNGSGGAKTYSPQLRAITIDLLSDGLSGSDIVRSFHAFALHGDMLDAHSDVPRPDWVRSSKLY